MKNTLFIVIISIVLVVAISLVGCDTRKVAIEKSKQQFKEAFKQQSEIQEKQVEELEKYKEDFGVYPDSLEQLKQAGFEIYPLSKGWRWSYRKVENFYQLMPEPDVTPSNTGQTPSQNQ